MLRKTLFFYQILFSFSTDHDNSKQVDYCLTKIKKYLNKYEKQYVEYHMVK